MTTFVKMILPVAVFALASAGAVSTKMVKEDSAKSGISTEWIQNPDATHCLARTVDCSTVLTAQLCMADSNSRQVFRKNVAGQCNILLYKINP